MFLTDAELYALTKRQRRKAQVRMLRAMGIEHKVRADGTVAVLKSHVEKEMGGATASAKIKRVEPDWSNI